MHNLTLRIVTILFLCTLLFATSAHAVGTRIDDYEGVHIDKCQCVVWAQKFANAKYDSVIPPLGANGGARLIWEDASKHPSNAVQIANAAGTLPNKDDIVVFSGAVDQNSGAYGHVGIVYQVNSRTDVVLVDTNWNGDELGYTHSVNLNWPSVYGWFHENNNPNGSAITRYSGSNPATGDIKNMLIAAGQKWHIPPQILFGMAFQESGWRQYGSDGKTLVSGDGGIGIMQLTGATAAQFDVNRLASDIAYNIDSGAKVLVDKWNGSPIIGDGIYQNGREKLENWYYAIWYYNSGGNINNPNLHTNPYQDSVINYINSNPLGVWQSVNITKPSLQSIGVPEHAIANTPTPVHVDANFDGIIDGTEDTTPPTVTITSGHANGGTYDTPQRITWHISEDQSGIERWGQAWDTDPGANPYTNDGGYLDLPEGTHVLHVHVRDKAGNEKDWTFGPFTYTPQIQVGQGSDRSIDQRYVDCYNRIGAAILGTVSNNYVHTAIGSFGNGGAQDFAGGSGGHSIIMAKDGAALAFHVRGNIWNKYSGMSFAASSLGFPTSDEEDGTPSAKGTTGRVNHFEAGVITSTNAGTFEVHGDIFSKYANLSGSGGVLGFPTQDAAINPATVGRYGTSGFQQLFEGGGVFSSKFGTFALSGAIWSVSKLPILVGYYGYPSSEEQDAPQSPFGTSGRMISFEAGAFYSTNQYGVHGVGGEIYKRYAAAQSSAGKYGFPKSDAYSWNGGIRQDFEGGYITDGLATANTDTHLLWTNTSGAALIWNYDLTSGSQTNYTYGPYPRWFAGALADGPDAKTRLLWNNASGQMSLWNLDSSTGQFSQFSFGPYPGWTARTVSVGPDNTTHVLWASTSGAASVWNYSTATGTFTQHTYGPYPGWVPVALADGADGKTRMIWDNYDGRASFWSLDSSSGSFTQHTFGPYAGWTANAVSVSADGVTHLLWDDSIGRTSVWNYDPAAGSFTQHTSGPYSGWTAMGLASGSDGKTGLLWTNGGLASVWNYDPAGGGFSQFTFGPYSGWSAVGISAP